MSARLGILLLRLRDELGGVGLASLTLVAAVMAFHATVLGPMSAASAELAERARRTPRAEGQAAGSAVDKVGAVYDFLRKDESTTDWLAKLHAIGAASRVQLRSANYRSVRSDGLIQRYEMVVPVSGSYPQIRDFLRRSLAEIPVMSIDQVTLQRRNRNDAVLQGEIRMTLHMVKS
jgi:hypothetical protein